VGDVLALLGQGLSVRAIATSLAIMRALKLELLS
jgi:hypothetical protein